MVRLRRAREVVDEATMAKSKGWLENARRQNALYEAPTLDDAEWADAILFGTPCYFGVMATELKAYLDQLGPQWKHGALAGKVGGAFATASWPHGGSEVVTLSLYAPMAHLGMVIVPTGYTDEAMLQAGSPYGASASSAPRTGRRDPRIWTPPATRGAARSPSRPRSSPATRCRAVNRRVERPLALGAYGRVRLCPIQIGNLSSRNVTAPVHRPTAKAPSCPP